MGCSNLALRIVGLEIAVAHVVSQYEDYVGAEGFGSLFVVGGTSSYDRYQRNENQEIGSVE